MTSPARRVGTGVNLFATDDITGTARWFEDTSDVLSIDDADLDDTVAFVHKGGMTFLSPILPDLAAIVCTAGSRESHLAILSRESAVPSTSTSARTSWPTASTTSSRCCASGDGPRSR